LAIGIVRVKALPGDSGPGRSFGMAGNTFPARKLAQYVRGSETVAG